jgi:hypothetical protein
MDIATGGASVGNVGGNGHDKSFREIVENFIRSAPGEPDSWEIADLCEEKRHALLRRFFTRDRGQTSRGLRDSLGRFCEGWKRPSGKYSISIVMVDRNTGTTTPLPCVKGHH